MMANEQTAAIEEAILTPCQARGPTKSICPSDVARVFSDNKSVWRQLMPAVRTAASVLCREGKVIALQKGRCVDLETAKGPIRLRIASNARDT